ncbi:cysteine proteinase inhibitor 5-like [Pyrus communis]|uniref:cysteine proteinase inhibitor 5-like n=1 Tax=Pyrus communis TaxID=23211 RepID=UPI0035C1180A
MRPHYLVAFFVLLVPLVSAAKASWKPVNISDPSVVELGRWSVSEFNKDVRKQLVFEKLVSGGSAVFKVGKLYALLFAARNESLADSGDNYLAGAWVQWSGKKKLIAFYKHKGRKN